MSRAQYWCFTKNNYNDDDIFYMQSLVNEPQVTYIVFGLEVGEQGTPHLQGYVELEGRLTFNQVTQLLPGCHIEVRRGNAMQAKEYCIKDGDFIEEGEMSTNYQGKRNDLAEVQAQLDAGASLTQVANDHFASFVRYGRSFRQYQLLKAEVRQWETEIYVYWGDTGTGKTRKVHDEHDKKDIYHHPGGMWFDGYEGHDVVLFDDYSGSCMPLPYLLKICDRYPMQVPVKGGFVNWKPKKIFFTSNLNPNDWYGGAHPQHQAALRRRFTKVIHFESFARILFNNK